VAVTCREFLELLDADAVAGSAAARDHAASCAACGRALARARAASRELRAMGDEALPPFLAERVMARVRTARRAPAVAPVWWRRAHLLPALATLVVAILGGVALWRALGRSLPVEEARLGATRTEARVAPNGEEAAEQRSARPVPTAPGEVAGVAAAPAGAPARSRSALPVASAPRREASGAPAEPALAPRPHAATKGEREAPDEARRVAAGAEVDALAAAPAAPAATVEVATAPGADASAGKRLADRAAFGAAAAGTRASPARVAVRVQAPDGAVVRTIAMSDAGAPPPGVRWLLRVGRDGTLTLTDLAGSAIGERHPRTVAELATAGLPPGDFLLER